MNAPPKDTQISVKELKITQTPSQEARLVAEKAATEKKLAEEAIKTAQIERTRALIVLTSGNKESMRLLHKSMRMLSGGNATQETIANMMRAEIRIINNESIPTDQKQEKFQKVQSQYDKLLTFTNSRNEHTKKNIANLKKSKNPVDQVAGFGI